MQKYIYLFAFALLFFSCNKQSKIETAVEKIPIKMKLHRFEQAFFDAKVEDLAKVKLNYPDFFPIETPDNIWISKMQNPLWRELYAEVEKKYKNFDFYYEYFFSKYLCCLENLIFKKYLNTSKIFYNKNFYSTDLKVPKL